MKENTRKIIMWVGAGLIAVGAIMLFVVQGTGGQTLAMGIIEAVFAIIGIVMAIIGQFVKSTSLAEVLTKEFKKGIVEVLEREEAESYYMPQSDFKDCKERASAMIDAGTPAAKNVLELAIIKHREDKHFENRETEEVNLKSVMTDSQIKSASRGFWRY